MQTGVIEVGEKIHLITRRHFKEDVRRHFCGVVTAIDGSAMRVEGFTFIVSPIGLEVRKLNGLRTRIFGVTSADNIINILPPHVDISRLIYKARANTLAVTDGQDFWLEVNEHL